MKFLLVTTTLVLGMLVSCSSTDESLEVSTATKPEGKVASHSGPMRANVFPTPQTVEKVRDNRGARLTADDQSMTQADVDITAKVRQALVADGSLSTDAHNVKVITRDGVVTLRGPVRSVAERNKVVTTARDVAAGRVNNQLEVVAE